jgi:hypothetical protein
MKKLSIFLAFIAFAFIAQAQNPVIWACNQPSGGIEIYFDLNENCAAAPGDLSGMSEIGFHSGANMWSAVVDWDNCWCPDCSKQWQRHLCRSHR